VHKKEGRKERTREVVVDDILDVLDTAGRKRAEKDVSLRHESTKGGRSEGEATNSVSDQSRHRRRAMYR
jgi:hypothetical protein